MKLTPHSILIRQCGHICVIDWTGLGKQEIGVVNIGILDVMGLNRKCPNCDAGSWDSHSQRCITHPHET